MILISVDPFEQTIDKDLYYVLKDIDEDQIPAYVKALAPRSINGIIYVWKNVQKNIVKTETTIKTFKITDKGEVLPV